MRSKVFIRYPWLFFVVAAIVISNNIFKYAPAQVLKAPISFIIPILFIVAGVVLYYRKRSENKA